MRSLRQLSLSLATLLPLLGLLAGCAMESTVTPSLNTTADGIHGTLMGGQQPVFGAMISIYAVGSTGYGTASTTPLAMTTSSLIDGSYSFAAAAYTCPAANTPMYMVAIGGTAGGYALANTSSALMALIPQCATGKSSFIIINEVTTAAAVLAAGQFFNTALGNETPRQIGAPCSGCATGTYNKGLVAAFSNTYPMLVDNAHGVANGSTVANGITITREQTKLNTIANVLAACVNSTGSTSTTETTTTCGQLFTDVNATGASARPYTTLQAALEMALYPYYNVPAVYGLISGTPPFAGLGSAPNDWTVAISYTTPSFGLGITQNTSSSLDIDASGNIWFPSNQTGAQGLAYFSPSTTTFNGPYGGSVTYPQYVAIDQSTPAFAYATDLSSSYLTGVTTTAPASTFSVSSTSYTSGGPLAFDNSNELLFAGNGTTHSLYTVTTAHTAIKQATSQTGSFTPSASPNGVGVLLTLPYTNGDVYAADTSTACNLEFSPGTFVSNGISTGTSTCLTGGILPVLYANGALMTTSPNAICSYGSPLSQQNTCPAYSSLSTPKGLALDGTNRVWVANAGNASIAVFSLNESSRGGALPVAVGSGYYHGSSYGATLTTPYGIGIDASGNVWVSNASCVATSTTACSASGYTLTEIVGAAGPTITPVSAQESGSATQSGTRPTN